MQVNIGIDETDRILLSKKLERVLADTFSIYLIAQNFHWNIKGKHFGLLHNFFGEQYEEYYEALDPIAERILALGYNAPCSYREFLMITSLLDPPSVGLHAKDMLNFILNSQDLIIYTINEALEVAERINDVVTIDLLTRRAAVHQKYAWQTRKHLED